MDMSIWTHSYGITGFGGDGKLVPYTTDYYTFLYDLIQHIPNISKFFSINGTAGYSSLYTTSAYWSGIHPKYGPNFSRTFNFPFCSRFDHWSAFNAQNYLADLLQFYNNRYVVDEYYYHTWQIDYANINGVQLYGAHWDYNYTQGYPTLFAFIPAKTLNNVDQYITVAYSPNGKQAYLTGSHTTDCDINNLFGFGTTNSEVTHAPVQNESYIYTIKDEFINPNYGKCDDYILSPLIVNGCVANNAYFIDGGREFIPDFSEIVIGNNTYWIFNRFIAIKK